MTIVLAAVGMAVAFESAAPAQTPTPELGFAAPSDRDAACEPETERVYPECRRLRFRYGPIAVTPGNNAQLYTPVTIEKPGYDGYAVRVRPDLVRSDGKAPPVDVVHLHHGVWASIPAYGYAPAGQFFGVGEEKTILGSPPGYGMLVRASDTWVLNYMLHNATTSTETLWITYDLDYVPRQAAERRGIKRVVPLWLDVEGTNGHPFYPVFNVQRGYGKHNPRSGKRECVYPRDRCAAFNPYGADQPGNGRGWDWEVSDRYAGTLVAMGGHVHPGGLRDEVSVVRRDGGRERVRRIFNSEAVYYDPNGPVSWDHSMTVTRPDWRVRVRPGDRIRLNAVYDAERASWYEGMGIVLAFIAPGDDAGIDPFERVRASRRASSRRRGKARRDRGKARYRYLPIALKGVVTHGHLPENSNHGGGGVRPLPDRGGRQTSDVTIANFRYSPGDLSSVGQEGIPLVKAGGRLTFWNADAMGQIYHTVTTCEAPCNGSAGISYPLADDDNGVDSLEMGYGLTYMGISPTANRQSYSLVPREAGLRSGRTYTYFCRVHPFMRGAFKVVE